MSSFTDTYIKSLKPKTARYEEYEGGGFGIRVTPNGIKTWIYRYKIDGKTDKLTLGHYPTMSGLIHKIHLSEQVKTLLNELKELNDSGYVISGTDNNQPLTENALARAIKRIQKRLDIPHWTAHDLRRTMATQLGETLRIDPVVIEKCLGHKMPRIMATYNKNEILHERKEALNKWGKYIENIIAENNIISLLRVKNI